MDNEYLGLGHRNILLISALLNQPSVPYSHLTYLIGRAPGGPLVGDPVIPHVTSLSPRPLRPSL